MSEQQKEMVRRLFEEVFNKDQLDRVPDFYTEDFCGHDSATQSEFDGYEKVRDLLKAYRAKFPDHRYIVEEVIGEGDYVCVRWSVVDIDRSKAPDLRIEGLSLCQFRDGKVCQVWQHWDDLGLLQRLGDVDENMNVAASFLETTPTA